jgi:hypothetical protein
MAWQSVPICERCWLDETGEWVTSEDGVTRSLVSVRIPIRLREPKVEACYACSEPTISDIYVRREVP